MTTDDPLPKSQERKLAGRAADGDSDAVGELYDAYERRLFGYCARMLGNPEDAADATQEAFCNVIQRLPGLDTAQLNFGAYLFTAARNASLDILKSQGRFQSTDEVPEDPFAVAPVESDPERALLTGDQMRAAREANARLPEKQRAALALREVAELSYDDIGEALDMNQNAVAQLISRARMNFGKQLRVGSIVVEPQGEEAQRALELTAARIDGKIAADDSAWLTAYLATDETSRLNAEAMEESAVLYRGIGVLAVVAGLRETVLAQATGSGSASSSAAQAAGEAGSDGPTLVQAGPGAVAGVPADQDEDADLGAESQRHRQRLIYPIAAALILLLILAVAAIGEGEPDQASDVVPGVTASTSKASAGKTDGKVKNGSKGDPRSSQAQNGSSPGLAAGGGESPGKGSKKNSGDSDRGASDAPKDSDTPTTSDPATPPATPPAEDPPPSTPPPGGGGIPAGPGGICAQAPCTPPPPVP